MYTKEIYPAGIFSSVSYTVFRKDGHGIIAERRENEKEFHWTERDEKTILITRTQAFRYWRKYFPGIRSCDLPRLLKEATELDDRKHLGILVYPGGYFSVEWKEDY